MSKTKRHDPAMNADMARLALQAAVGKRVRKIRTAQKVGQAECARNAGMDKSSMYRLEKGQQNVTIDTLARIALVLNVDIVDFLAGVTPDPALIVSAAET